MPTQEELDEYLVSFTDISPATDKGILKKIIKEGTPTFPPCKGDTACVHYVGTYFGGDQHGVQFDSSRDRNSIFEFAVNEGKVITAWDTCIPTMSIGEVCELVATPENCYMDGKSMKFEIELFEFKGQDISTKRDGSVQVSALQEGSGHTNPAGGSNVSIILRQILGVSESKDREVSYVVGDYHSANVPYGVDLALRNMKTEQVVRVTITSACLEDQSFFPADKDVSKIVFEVTLKSMDRLKHVSTFKTFDEQIQYSETIKDKANVYFKDGKIALAKEIYEFLLDDLQYIASYGIDEKKRLNSINIAINLNMALLFLKQDQPDQSIAKCNQVFTLDANNEKALFRIGQAYVAQKDSEAALVYFKRLVELYPNNSSAVNQLKSCEEVIRRAQEKEKQIFRSVFSKLQNTGFDEAQGQSAGDHSPEKSAS